MKKKSLFIEDLEQRRSTSSLFTSLPAYTEDAARSVECSKKQWKKPSDTNSGNAIRSGKQAKSSKSEAGSLCTTQRLGEEGGSPKPEDQQQSLPGSDSFITHRVGEDIHSSKPEDGQRTTMALGEEGNPPKPGDGTMTTMALGEEGNPPKPGDGKMTTQALGEEGKSPKDPPEGASRGDGRFGRFPGFEKIVQFFKKIIAMFEKFLGRTKGNEPEDTSSTGRDTAIGKVGRSSGADTISHPPIYILPPSGNHVPPKDGCIPVGKLPRGDSKHPPIYILPPNTTKTK